MKQLVYGTKNKSKIESIKKRLSSLDVEIIGIGEMDVLLPNIKEDGNSPKDNAVIKAREYYKAIKRPVFSADSGLFFDEVSKDEQPGTMVRRVNGKSLSDDEMIEYYAGLAKKYGGKLKARYINSIAVALDEDNIIVCEDKKINSEPFYIVDKPHTMRNEGFPLDSISVEIASGEHYFELEKTKYGDIKKEAYERFFEGILKEI